MEGIALQPCVGYGVHSHATDVRITQGWTEQGVTSCHVKEIFTPVRGRISHPHLYVRQVCYCPRKDESLALG